MPLTKEQKKKILENLKEKLDKQKALIFVDFTGLKVKDLSSLRKELKKAFGELKVAKKTLLSLSLKEKGLKIEKEKLKGEIAMIFGYQDVISPSKMVYQFSKTNPNIKILGGFLENQFKEAEDIIMLAQLPSREVLISRLVGNIASPISGFINALQYNLKGLMYLLTKIKA